MHPDEQNERAACAGTEPMISRAQRYMKQALDIEVEPRKIQSGSVLEVLHAWTIDYLTARRRVCQRIASERSEGGYIMRSLRVDPMIPFTRDSTYDPIGRRAEFPLAVEIREIVDLERRLTALAAAWKRDNERE